MEAMAIIIIVLTYFVVGIAYMTLALWESVARGDEPDTDTAWTDMLLWPLGIVLVFVRVLPTLLAEKLAAWMVCRHSRKE